ncbi:MAG: RDD family protein [Defluviitaleaceae bacterium]|nr:RDD family protein [Defluviitaleaceae bacterium]
MRDKMDILGILCDDSLDRFRERIGLNMGLSALVGTVFVVLLGGFVLLTINVIAPAFPILFDNQIVTDNIVFGVIVALFLLLLGFFLKLNQAASIVACHGPRDEMIEMGLAAKILLRRAFAVFSVTLAQSFLVLIIFGIFGVIMVINITNFALAGIFGFLLLFSIILHKTLSFFAITVVVTEKKYFFAAIALSARLVFERGFLRIFAIVALLTILNLLIFLGLFLALHGIFSPTELIGGLGAADLYFQMFDPLIYILVMFACLPMMFVAPRLSLVALSFYEPPAAIAPQAGLASRALAVILDILLLVGAFIIIFMVTALAINMNFYYLEFNFAIGAILAAAFFLVFMLYNIGFEAFAGGQTPGKRLMSLRVTTEDGEPVTFVNSILRNALRIIDIVSFVMIVIDRKHHRLGDVLSYTKVCFYYGDDEVEDTDV